MKIPVCYSAVCPECREEVWIETTDAGYYWLADTVWRCPNCNSRATTKQLQDASKSNK